MKSFKQKIKTGKTSGDNGDEKKVILQIPYQKQTLL